MELDFEYKLPTKHLSREIISSFFEKEKVLRTLTDEERQAYLDEYNKEVHDYISLEIDFGPSEENGKWGVKHHALDTFLVVPVYDEVTTLEPTFSSYGYYKTRNGDRYGLITASCYRSEVIVPPIYDDILEWEKYSNEEKMNTTFIVYCGSKIGLICHDKLVLEPEYERFTGNRIGVQTKKEGKYGLYIFGKVIPAIYDEIRIPQIVGWIKARLGETWGYFDYNWNFTPDIAKAFQIIDTTEDVQFDTPSLKKKLFEAFAEWMEETPQLEDNIPDNVNYLYDDYSPDYDEWPKPIFNKQTYFRTDEGIGLCQRLTGQILIPAVYDALWRNSPTDLYVYKKHNKFGVVSIDGTEKCPPVYDEVMKPDELWWGVLVRKGNQWDYIDYIIDRYPLEPEYDEIMVEERGLLLRKNGKIGYCFGGFPYEHPPIPAVYDGIFIPEVAGWIRVCKDGEWGYLNKHNEFTIDLDEAYSHYFR